MASYFDHTKIFTVAGIWSLIGSTNRDPRSLRLNVEHNLECYDPELVTGLERLMDERIVLSCPVTMEYLQSMPLGARVRDGLARLASPYL